MFLYSFSRFFGQDKIVSLEGEANAGDLLLVAGEYFLCLGDKTAWGCEYEMESVDFLVAEIELLSTKSIELLHRVVYECYSSYKNSVNLFFGSDLEKLLQRKLSSSSRKPLFLELGNTSEIVENKKQKGQSLLLFPNLWMLYSYLGDYIDKKKIAVISSSNTEKQKNEIFRGVKEGRIKSLACTHAGLFQDRNNLSSISIFDPHARYYKNRQDPRYDTVNTCEKLSSMHDCKLIFSS